MDSLFIVDDCYETFVEAYDHFKRVLPLVEGSKPHLELMRLSFSGGEGEKWLEQTPLPPRNLGWHFRVEAKDEITMKSLEAQLQDLGDTEVSSKLKTTPLGGNGDLELEMGPGIPPRIVIPFEDRVENTCRFFRKFSKGLAKATDTSESSWNRIWKEFHSHAQNGLENEDVFPVKVPGLFGFKPKEAGISLKPKRGFVGKHEIFQALQLEVEGKNIGRLLRIFTYLNQRPDGSLPPLYLQFFSPSVTPVIERSFLHELTLSHEDLSFQEGCSYLETLNKTSHAKSIQDCFIVFDQKHAKLDKDCIATFTLRKTLHQGFEIRVNATWEKPVDPDMAFSSISRKSGLTWSRMI